VSALEHLVYRDGATTLTGHVARPAGPARGLAVVFPTIMNLTPAVAARTTALAEAGFLAFVADFYGESVPDITAAFGMAETLRRDTDVYRTRLTAAVNAARSLPEATSLPALAIGFCMGGQAVLELARGGADLALVASFHGLLETGRPAESKIVPRILVCHGDADALVPRAHVLRFWEEMDGVGADWHFHSYAGVGHGFTNPNPPPAGGPSSYDPSADRQSWVALMSLCDELFGARPA
jgi:dienelactone hydrolase